MRTEEEITADARPGRAFSNSTMWEMWTVDNCGRGSGCLHDADYGTAPEGTHCPIITVALISDSTPAEWPDDNGDTGQCTQYEEFVAHATDDEPADPEPDPTPHPDQTSLF
jgi:hypothetical protein